MAKVFLSHASTDKKLVRRLATDLATRGHDVWLDEWSIRVGDSIPTKIAEGLQGADFVAVLLTAASTNSAWVDREWKAKYWQEVETRKVSVLPLLVETCEIPMLLREKRYANFVHDYEVGLAELLSTLEPRPLIQTGVSVNRRELALELLEEAHSRDRPLSLVMMKILRGAAVLDDKDLDDFCRSELTGPDTSMGLTSELLAHRRISGYLTFGQLNPLYAGWGENLSNALTYMRSQPKEFIPRTLVFEQALSRIEADLPTSSPKKLVFFAIPAKVAFEGAIEGAEAFFYAAGDALADVYERIRVQLITRLSQLI